MLFGFQQAFLSETQKAIKRIGDNMTLKHEYSFAKYALVVLVMAMFLVVGCKKRETKLEDAIPTPIPPTSKFAKIGLGWSMGRVHDTIGKPNDTRHYMTGKVFIPLYFGSDSVRLEDLYKGEGRIIYAGGSGFGNQGYTVFKIIYDPTESGYNDQAGSATSGSN